MTFAGTLATVSRTFAVSPLQMRFRTPRRADTRRSCLQARTCAGEMTTFAMHKRMYSQERGGVSPPWSGNTRAAETANLQQTRTRATQERGASAPRGSVTRAVCRMDRAPFSDMRPTIISSGRTFAQYESGGRKPPVVIHHVRAAAIVSTTSAVSPGDTMRWIADYGRLARRISPQLARPSHGLRAVGQATASPDFSTAGGTMRWIADYGRLARRISPELARPCNGLRIARELTSPADFSTAGETGRLIAEGTLAGIMAINGSSVPTVSASVGWAETLRMRLTACQGRVCRLSRQVPAGQRRRAQRERCPSQERARPVGRCGWAVSTVAIVAWTWLWHDVVPELAEQTTRRGSAMTSLRH
jgi:hypothetical protein